MMYGDKENGVEVRYIAGEIDEVLLWKDGKCVAHIEQMDDSTFWIGFGDVHFNFRSKSGRAEVEINDIN